MGESPWALRRTQIQAAFVPQTAEHLTLSSLGKSTLSAATADEAEKGDRGRSVFTEDTLIPAPFRARLQDYFRSGYDRGHM